MMTTTMMMRSFIVDTGRQSSVLRCDVQQWVQTTRYRRSVIKRTDKAKHNASSAAQAAEP